MRLAAEVDVKEVAVLDVVLLARGHVMVLVKAVALITLNSLIIQ